ncbi:MAG: hypothetical protein ACRD0G_04265 [Acidimicrobiales bacterium]
MKAQLENDAEIQRLSRLLGVDADELTPLAALDPEAVRAFRRSVVDALYDTDLATFQRLAAASKLLPPPAMAAIAKRAFGPLMCARITGLLEPKRAIDVAGRLSDEFLTEVAVELDPRRSSAVIERFPADRVAAVGRELAARDDVITISQFVDHLSTEALRAGIDAISDEGVLLRAAFLLESKDRLTELIGLLPDDRLPRLIARAHEEGLWRQALAVIGDVEGDVAARLGELVAQQPDAVLDNLVDAAQHQGLWDVLLPIVGRLSTQSLARFASIPALDDEAVLANVVAAADTARQWPALLPLVPSLPAGVRSKLGSAVERLDSGALARALTEANASNHWPALVDLVDVLGGEALQRAALAVADADDAVLAGLLGAAGDHKLWPSVLRVLTSLPGDVLTGQATRAARLDVDRFLPGIIDAADTEGLWEEGLRVLASLDDEMLAGLTPSVERLTGEQARVLGTRIDELGLRHELGPLGAALPGNA